MSVRFSLIYPTRHRPAFIRQALRFLERQKYSEFEVIVSDNYVDPTLSCAKECQNSPVANVKYVRPPQPLGMVENWNFALQFATGDYVCYFTDKMFLLPEILSLANVCIEKSQPEIVTWVDNLYYPNRFPEYFGEGVYSPAVSSVPVGAEFSSYDPLEELSLKGRAEVARQEQDKSSYARGKICFGAYRADLCARIVQKAGALFHNVSPDYTSMILGLSLAKSAAEVGRPGIVHVNTDLSNGGQIAIRDEVALRYLTELGKPDKILEGCLVPGLYSSMHNLVAHDYLTLQREYGLSFQFDTINWLVYITEDLDVQGRCWSSPEVESQQRALLLRFLQNLPKSQQDLYRKRLKERASGRQRLSPKQYAYKALKAFIPPNTVKQLKSWLRGPQSQARSSRYCSEIEDIL